jgi:hypothetical protein
MSLIEQLNIKELSELLSKCWMAHEGTQTTAPLETGIIEYF